jgi:hypothetical protein
MRINERDETRRETDVSIQSYNSYFNMNSCKSEIGVRKVEMEVFIDDFSIISLSFYCDGKGTSQI